MNAALKLFLVNRTGGEKKALNENVVVSLSILLATPWKKGQFEPRYYYFFKKKLIQFPLTLFCLFFFSKSVRSFTKHSSVSRRLPVLSVALEVLF